MDRTPVTTDCFIIDDLLLNVREPSLVRDQQVIKLRGLTFDLLLCLVRHSPHLVTKETLLAEIWPSAHVGEETLKQRVRLLRNALGDNSKAPRYLETIRGRGYRLIPTVMPHQAGETKTASPRRQAPRWRSWFLTLSFSLAAVFAVALIVQKGARKAPTPTLSSSQNPNAQELFERGKAYYRRYLPKENETSIKLLKQAILADPEFSAAHALLSKAYSQQPKMGNGYWGKQAEAAAHRAIELASDKPEGYIALGLAYDVSGRPDKGNEAYALALEIDPNHGVALANTACNFMNTGKLVKSLSYNLRSRAIKPDTYFTRLQIGESLRLLGFTDHARPWLEKAILLQPDNALARASYSRFLLLEGQLEAAQTQLKDSMNFDWAKRTGTNFMGNIHFFSGDFSEAKASFEKTWCHGSWYGGFRLGMLKHLLNEEDASEILSQVQSDFLESLAKGNKSSDVPLFIAAIKATQSRPEEALLWLDKALEAGYVDARWLNGDPGLLPLRQIPGYQDRYAALLENLASMRQQVLDQRLISQEATAQESL